MNSSLHKKREDFANKIRSEQKQAYFERQRKKLIEAQKEGDIDLEGQIYATLIGMLGSEAKVQEMLFMYEEYEKSRQEYERRVEQDEEASINFQRMQDLKKREEEKAELLALFQELQDEEKQDKENKDIEI